jgi:hypothetical protein
MFAFDVSRSTASRRRHFRQALADASGLPLNEEVALSN